MICTIPILYYHRVGPFRPGRRRKMNVDPAAFASQMQWLHRMGHRTITPEVLMAAVAGTKPAPPGAMMITFDDGYRDLIDHALPVLKRLKFTALFFIVASARGGMDVWNDGGGREPEPVMDDGDLRALLREGMAIGSHSMTHRSLVGRPSDVLRDEIERSRNVLGERTGRAPAWFAYPKGEYDERAIQCVNESGYMAAFATRSGAPPSWEDRFRIRRIPVGAGDGTGRFAFKMVKFAAGRYE